MDGSNGQPVDSRLIAAPTVAPPPGVRPMAQPVYSQPLAPQMGLHTGFRPAQFASAAASGIPLFQAQAPPMVSQSLGARKSSLDRSKAVGLAGAGRKQCNCKNSRCLKLYCECFASGRYCENCNCVQCYNNREHEATRQSAVEAILERNPNAFRPKIQSNEQTAAAAAAVVNNAAVPGRHLKGCNCKKSSCLKKYCECFQAGIYCSDNCKCVECKNFEDAVSGFGVPGGGAKRMRPNSAPPPSVQGSLGLAAAAQGVSLGAIRPGLVQPGGLGALVQQQHGVGGLPMGLAGAVAAAAAAGGAARPGIVGSLAGLGPGGMASLPQALSLALAAASGSAPQLMSLQSAAAAAGATSGQPGGPPVIIAPGGQQLVTPAPPLPLRAKMQEVVNGMVKRSVIEELCRLLWMVADDEAAPVRGTTATASATAGSSSRCGTTAGPQPDGAQAGSGILPGPLPNGVVGSRAALHLCEVSTLQHGAMGTVLGGGADGGYGGGAAGLGGIEVKTEAGGPEGQGLVYSGSHAEAGQGPGATSSSGPGPDGPLVAADGLGHSGASGDAVAAAAASAAVATCGSYAEGHRGGGAPDGLGPLGPGQTGQQQLQQQPRRPGPLYGRKERVVLEEFLSIMNKISETAAKKLQQHGSAAPPPSHLQQPHGQQQQSYMYSQGVPIVLPPGAVSAQQQHPGGGPPPGAAYASMVRPGGHPGAVAVVAPPGFSNGQVIYPLGPYSAAAGSSAQPPTVLSHQAGPYSAAGAATPPDGGGVFVVSPAMGVGVAGPHQQPSQVPPEQEQLQQQQAAPQHIHHPLHGNVPFILAPPRGSHGTGAPPAAPQSFFPSQQQQHLESQPHQQAHQPGQQRPGLHTFGGEEQAQSQQPAGGPYTTPFLPFSTGLPVPMSADAAGSQQPSQQLDQQQGEQQAAALLHGIMAASEQQLALWTAVSERQALLQAPVFQQQLSGADHGAAAGGGGDPGCSLAAAVAAAAGEEHHPMTGGDTAATAVAGGASTDGMNAAVL